jgi:hypothetical protein
VEQRLGRRIPVLTLQVQAGHVYGLGQVDRTQARALGNHGVDPTIRNTQVTMGKENYDGDQKVGDIHHHPKSEFFLNEQSSENLQKHNARQKDL